MEQVKRHRIALRPTQVELPALEGTCNCRLRDVDNFFVANRIVLPTMGWLEPFFNGRERAISSGSKKVNKNGS